MRFETLDPFVDSVDKLDAFEGFAHFLVAFGIDENTLGDSVDGKDFGFAGPFDSVEIGLVVADKVGDRVDLGEIDHRMLFIKYTVEFHET